MPADYSLELRKAVVDALLDDAGVSGIVGARVYGPQPPALPTLPFVSTGLTTPESYEATCYDGMTGTFRVHAFSDGPGDDEVTTLAAAIVEALSGFVMPGDLVATEFEWLRTETIRDIDDAQAYHAIIAFQCTVVAV